VGRLTEVAKSRLSIRLVLVRDKNLPRIVRFVDVVFDVLHPVLVLFHFCNTGIGVIMTADFHLLGR
jgi:hypothetical protein